ncbi:dnaJ homolog subfamily C member 16-like isoform X2 [Dendronephthya gigantea]|uniref:dnaJ homolog subfamily C member 16-like isoform X2 n=1 Tax=Dendronephthya gigantea TaxID=151771 RepID=UPI00106D3BE0|nr:dnaJ homolog subfamily C member 16-like isoform X2 [Dendronephthya gigantea]
MASVYLSSKLFLVFVIYYQIVYSEDDYYSILGLRRNADSEEIRRAYRQLAKEWHPDKNTRSDAQETFIKINKAYETLSDPKKREGYDRYGEAGPTSHHEEEFEFFQDAGFMFFNGMPYQSRHEDFITFNFFEKTILPESYKKLYLLQIVSNWCVSCEAVEEIWDYTARDLKNHGIGTGNVNRNMDPQLAKFLGVRKLPDFVAVISGKLYHYTGTVSVQNLKNFVSGIFSKHHYIPEVTNSNCKEFLSNWYDNKPRALLFTTKKEAPLLLKIVAFKYQNYVGVGYAQASKSENNEMRARYQASKYEPTFMIFKENISKSHVLLQASDLKYGVLDVTISDNLYLQYPRLSSQEMFETLCPAERSVLRRSLCVILFTNSAPIIQHSLPSMSKDVLWKKKRVRFVYVNPDVQQAFESAIKMNEKSRTICRNKLMSKRVAILWRIKDNEVKYTWFEDGWCGPKDVVRLTNVLNDIKEEDVELEMSAVVPEFYNEHAKNVQTRVSDLWSDLVYYTFHYINWSGHLPALSLAITFGFAFLISFAFPSMTCPQGQLVIVLLSDATSVSEAELSPVVQAFAHASRSYQTEKNLTFGWLSIPEHIAWCNEVMKVQTFGEITAGTVLALNGAKKYLSIFKIKKAIAQDAGNVFDDSEEDESSPMCHRDHNDSSKMVFREDRRTQKQTATALAQQFPRWIEKLLEGMVTRVKIDCWPRLECDQ